MIRIALSAGDPVGIGAEIVAKSLCKYRPPNIEYFVFGAMLPFEMLSHKFLWAKRFLKLVADSNIHFREVAKMSELEWGKIDAEYGDAAFKSLVAAAEFAKNGNADAIVTAPISKEAMQLAGHDYPGHTEILAEIFDRNVTMMLFAKKFRVSLATTHIPLRDVADAIDEEMLIEHIKRTDDALKNWFGIEKPKIAVLALNPHAGEGGKIGEEEYIISAAIKSANKYGMNIVGPLVPDVAFLSKMRRKFDAYLAMFHDQGLIPLKTLGFNRGVNITLGLPLPRTSPDHGTAFDIAGQGIASPLSFINALRSAVKIARNTKYRI